MGKPNEEDLLKWAGYVALLLLIVEVLYEKFRALSIHIAEDIKRMPSQISYPLAWLCLGVIIALVFVQFFSNRSQ
jgi:hypothetical protein